MDFCLSWVSCPEAQICYRVSEESLIIREKNEVRNDFLGGSLPQMSRLQPERLVRHLEQAQSGLYVKTITIIPGLQLSLIQSCCEKMS